MATARALWQAAGRLARRRSTAVATPVLPQAEDWDCGPACLRIVLAYHGRHVPAHEVREKCGVNRNGVTAAALVLAAAGYGLRAAGKRIAPGGPDNAEALLTAAGPLPTPAIVLLADRHFVVLEGITPKGQAAINDPAAGRRLLSGREFSEVFSSVALTFAKTPAFRSEGAPEWWPRTCWRWLGACRWHVLAAGAAGAAAGMLTVAAALLVSYTADRIEAGAGAGVGGAVLAVFGTAAAIGAAACAQRRLTTAVAMRLAGQRGERFLRMLLAVPAQDLQRRSAGHSASQVASVGTACTLLAHRVVIFVAGLAMIIPLLAAMAVSAMPLAIAVAAAGGASGLLRWVASCRGASDRLRLQGEQPRRHTLALSGFHTIDALHAQGADADLFGDLTDLQADDTELRDRVASSARWPLAAAGGAEIAAFAAAAWLGVPAAAGGAAAADRLLGFLVVGGTFLVAARSVCDSALGLPALARRAAILDQALDTGERRAIPAASYDPAAHRLAGLVELDNLTFSYDPAQPPLFDEVALRIEPGQQAVLVGATGSGKSTLLRMITAGLSPQRGEVLLDGHALADIAPARLLRSVGWVSQRPWLFEGSAADNLTLFDAGIPDAQISRAVTDACVADVLTRRGGYRRARVDSDGRNFSISERQRLALARALARDPSILVVDAATGAVEPDLAAVIDGNIRRRRITTITVPHPARQAEAIRHADVVFELDRGRVLRRDPRAARPTAPRPDIHPIPEAR
ncbi:MAG TPA: ATP-binding cassette domain-containing protein [Streptosporangiaceae bacterium]|nr:ATP-binding cassette domain-containing protein [Streptosporangiaceae bacterium]